MMPTHSLPQLPMINCLVVLNHWNGRTLYDKWALHVSQVCVSIELFVVGRYNCDECALHVSQVCVSIEVFVVR